MRTASAQAGSRARATLGEVAGALGEGAGADLEAVWLGVRAADLAEAAALEAPDPPLRPTG